MIEDVGNGWFLRTERAILPMHRTGWCGVWDAFKAWVTGDRRRTVDTPVVAGVYTQTANTKILFGAHAHVDEE